MDTGVSTGQIVENVGCPSTEPEENGMAAGEILHFEDGRQLPGRDPNRRRQLVHSFNDPDGNGWMMREVASRSSA